MKSKLAFGGSQVSPLRLGNFPALGIGDGRENTRALDDECVKYIQSISTGEELELTLRRLIPELGLFGGWENEDLCRVHKPFPAPAILDAVTANI